MKATFWTIVVFVAMAVREAKRKLGLPWKDKNGEKGQS